MPDDNDTPSLRKDRVRLVYLVKRRKDLTHEEFSDYWLKVHSKIFAGSSVAHQYMSRYEQMHPSVATQKIWQEKYGIRSTTFDGVGLFEADSFEDIRKVFDSEEYKTNILPDEYKFLDQDGCQIIPMNFWVGFHHTNARM
ncbi:hypothetical protein K523DRAFT_251805 [Schizophyllum commune Tattone D]|nr:hypothetical protein K523DRAFT_251805 [Schizophyllum commune Tattone D]